MVSPRSYIEPNVQYNLRHDFLKLESGYEKSGTVYFRNDFEKNDVPDMARIPFESGDIAFLDEVKYKPSSDDLLFGEVLEIGKQYYKKKVSYPFNKGRYCKISYDLVKKINRIQQEDSSIMPRVRITHTGAAVDTGRGVLPRDALNLDYINAEYGKLCGPELASHCYQVLKVAIPVALVVIFAMLATYSQMQKD